VEQVALNRHVFLLLLVSPSFGCSLKQQVYRTSAAKSLPQSRYLKAASTSNPVALVGRFL
jgi:hypothetical protein